MPGTNEQVFVKEMTKMMPALLREVSKKNESALTKMNLSLSHIVVLDVLNERGPSAMWDIAKSLGLTMSAATGIVDKMIKMNLVRRERSPEDRRVVKVAILKKGKDSIEKVQKMRKDVVRDMYSVLTDEERGQYLRMLKKVYMSMLEEK